MSVLIQLSLLLLPLCRAASVNVEFTDARRFQEFLHRHQYPVDCRDRVGALTRAGLQPNGEAYRGDYFYSLGLGSQIVSLKFNFVHALLKGHIYHFPTSHYVNPLRCKGQSFNCYFMKPTNCTLPPMTKPPRSIASPIRRSDHGRVETTRLLWCFDLPRRRLARLMGLRTVHSSAWFHGQLAAFLFRPNTAMRALREQMLSALEVNTSLPLQDRARAAGSFHNGSCAAMHIRGTDKFRGRRREDPRVQVGFHGFSHAYKSWAYWGSDRPLSQHRVLLGSEDKMTFRAMPTLLSPALTYWIPGRFFVMSSFKVISGAIINDVFPPTH